MIRLFTPIIRTPIIKTQRSKIERFGKIIIVIADVLLNTRSWEVSENMARFKYAKVLNIAGLSIMPGFWISRATQGLPNFVNIEGLRICIEMQLWTGSEYSKIPNMPGSCTWKL